MTATVLAPPEQAVTSHRRGRRQRPASTPGFRPDIEGLRAVAVALVVVYHLGINHLIGGYIGVDVFFVISGFLITTLLVREFEKTGRISIAKFYARRARRILPMASLVLLATIGASNALLPGTRMAAIARDGIWTAFFAANFRFSSDSTNYLNATAPPSPLQHYWSLAVEEQFYLVWPLLIGVSLWLALRLRQRHGDRRLSPAACGAVLAPLAGVGIAASLWWCIHSTTTNATVAYFSPFTRAWELGLGALIAVGAPWLTRLPAALRWLVGWAGLAAIIVAAVEFTAQTRFPGSAAIVPVAGAGAVLIGGSAHGGLSVRRLLGLAPLRRIGSWSYGIYLWHWPILVLAEARYPHLSLAGKLGFVVLAVALSAITYECLENPFRRWPALVASPARSIAVGIALVLLAAASSNSVLQYSKDVVTGANDTAQAESAQINALSTSTPAQVVQQVAAAVSVQAVPADVYPPVPVADSDQTTATAGKCLVVLAATTSPPCIFGDTSAKQTVVLLGDSHAAQWMPALQASAARAHFRLVVLTKISCPPLTTTVYSSVEKRAYLECSSWLSAAVARIAQLHPAMVAVSGTIHGVRFTAGTQPGSVYQSEWNVGLTGMLARLRPLTAKLAWISDSPAHETSVPDCLSTHAKDMQACNAPIGTAMSTTQARANRAAAAAAGATYVDVTPWLCTATTCPAVVDDRVTEFDDTHLTATYSRYLSHALGIGLGLEK